MLVGGSLISAPPPRISGYDDDDDDRGGERNSHERTSSLDGETDIVVRSEMIQNRTKTLVER